MASRPDSYGDGTQPLNPHETAIKVYPNPTTGPFTLEFINSTNTGSRLVEIYSMMGELVLSREISDEQSW